MKKPAQTSNQLRHMMRRLGRVKTALRACREVALDRMTQLTSNHPDHRHFDAIYRVADDAIREDEEP